MPEQPIAASDAINATGAVKLKGRRAWIAGLLAVLYPGLGHLYGGRPVLALLVVIGPWVFVAGALMFSAFYPRSVFPVLVALLVSYPLFWIWQLVSACLLSRRQGVTYRLTWYNRGLIYALFVIVLSYAWVPPFALLRQRVIEPFKIPSMSMAPTLIPGDQFFVVKSSPAASSTRGDIVVFRGPGERGIEPLPSVTKPLLYLATGFGVPKGTGRAWLARIIAVGGDTVEIRERQVLVNGQPYAQEPCEPAAPFPDSECVVERSFSGKSYSVLYSTALNGRRPYFPPVKVEAHHFYLLGDKRDDSMDSRYYGDVSEERVAGRAFVIWFSYSEADSIRWPRMGLEL